MKRLKYHVCPKMAFSPSHSLADTLNCSSSPIHFWANLDPLPIKIIILSPWTHSGECDCPQLPMAQYLVYGEWTWDICLFTKPQPSPKYHCIHFGFLFKISLPSPGVWTPSPLFLAMDVTLCQRTIWNHSAAILLIVIMASAWNLLLCTPVGRAGHPQIWILA